MSKIFIDTNLFVYSIDQKEPQKRDKAREILKKIMDSHQAVISTQVIKEFYVVASTKLKADQLIVKNIIHSSRNMEVVNNDLELIEQAIDINVISQLSFWDSLIIAAAEKADCDFCSRKTSMPAAYRGVTVFNPFIKEDF